MTNAVAPNNWCIRVSDKVYGPYTDLQMAAYAAEGRLTANSEVSPAGGTTWREARNFTQLASLFTKAPDPDGTSFGKATRSTSDVPDGAPAKFILIFDPQPGTAGRIEHILRSLGEGFRITENVWIVTSKHSVQGVKNVITPHLTNREFVFVIDSDRGRSAWYNFSPELHSRLTKMWVKTRK